ncbi:MAG: VF530 family DNA-binding protein [Motiliproteus sp.]
MSNTINYDNNPLNGVGLKTLLTEVVDHYGFEILFAYLNINCFKTNPSIDSSLTFLKKTEWAREKVEVFYLYQFKNLPRASSEQFALPPRDRVIPDDQKPREPAKLSFEDADRLREKRAKKVAARSRGAGDRSESGKRYGAQRERGGHANNRDKDRPVSNERDSSKASGAPVESGADPWAKWKS